MTERLWNVNYRMYGYILRKFPDFIINHFPAVARKSISSHSMVGLLWFCICEILFYIYECIDIFSDSPPLSGAMWLQVFSSYLGDNRKMWEDYDPVSLILQGEKLPEFFIEQGMSDVFYEEQLRTKSLERVCNEMNFNASLRYPSGYNNRYYLIPSFIDEHFAHHKTW